MTGPRITVDSEEFNPRPLRPQPLRPEAEPVNTYAAPKAGYELTQLASALQGIAPSLQRFTDQYEAKDEANQQEQATAAASKAHDQRLAYADAVKKGVIQPNDNPYFQKYFKQQSGMLAAGDYATALEGEMKTNPAWAESTDPNDFFKLEGAFKKQWLKDHVGDQEKDPHFAGTFYKVMDGVSQDAARTFAGAAGARMQLKAGEQLNELFNQTLDRGYSTNEDRGAVVAQLNAAKAQYLVDNPKGGTIANQQITIALQDYALAHPEHADEIFAMAKDIKAGSGNLYGLHIFKQMVNETQSKITLQQHEKLQLQHETETYADAKGERDMWSSLVNDISKAPNPLTFDVSGYVKQAQKFGNADDLVRRMYSLREDLTRKDSAGNDETFRDATLRLYGLDQNHPGTLTMGQLAGLMHLPAGQRISSSQFLELSQKIQERDRAADEGKQLKQMQVLTNPGFIDIKQRLEKSVYDTTDPHDTGFTASQADGDLVKAYLDRLPEIEAAKGPAEKQKILDSILHDVQVKWVPPDSRETAAEIENQTQDNLAKQGEFDSVVRSIKSPDDRRTMGRIQDEANFIRNNPRDKATGKANVLSVPSLQFLVNRGLKIPRGSKVDMEKIYELLSEYRRANSQ